MKLFILSVIIFLSAATSSARAKDYAEFTVDWSKGSLDQGAPMMCDDTYHDGIRLIILGRYQHDFSVQMTGPLEWRMTSIRATTLNGLPATEILIDADSDNGEIDIQQLLPGAKPGLEATIGLSDAC